MESERVRFGVENGVARVILNRPEKRNALDEATINRLRELLGRTREDPEVRAILLSGAGKDFCSGADLGSLREMTDAAVDENVTDARGLGELLIAMRGHPRPIVAAVRGRALAGGCGLATGCDLILAAESATFGYPEVNIGFVPAMVMAILRRSVSEKRAFELITSGSIIEARAALEMGLVNQVFADDDFDKKVEDYLDRLVGRSASAVSLSKALLYHMDGLTFETAIEAGVHMNALARMTEDCRRGIESFLKKT